MTRMTQLFLVLLFMTVTAKGATFSRHFISGPKVDILFVIDNSGSMQRAQQDLIGALPHFTEHMQNSIIDFHIGVTTTDAYRSLFKPDAAALARLRDGSDFTKEHSGVFVVTPETSQVSEVLATNLNQGYGGSGDERAFQSMKVALESPLNTGFLRSDAFLSVIIVSDEDDFSWNGSTSKLGQYTDSSLHTVQSYIEALDSITGVAPGTGSRHYSVNSIAVLDEDCLKQLDSEISGRRIGRRYIELTDLTGGFKGSICVVANAFAQYANFVVEQATRGAPEYVIHLDHTPIIDTIVIKINGRQARPDPANGWTFNAATNSVILHGESIPKRGEFVSVTYDYQE